MTKLLRITSLVSLTLILSACGLTHKQKFESFTESYQAGKYCDAADTALGEGGLCSTEVEKIDPTDFNIDEKLNAANALFINQNNALSNALLLDASSNIQEKFTSTGAARGTAEVLANASILDYNPMIMDSIYLHSYTLMNALALKDKEEARVQVNRAHSVQQNAVNVFSKEIEKEKEDTAQESEKIEDKDLEKANKKNIQDTLSNYKEFSKWKGYTNFVNPYVTYLSALYLMTNGSGNSDYETASNYLKRVSGMIDGNTFVKEDLAFANRLASGERNIISPTAWIIFENGLVANFEEFKLDLPIFLVTDAVKTASIALPYPKERPEAFKNISVSNGNKKVKTTLLTNVDNIFLSEFNKRLPTIITKAVTKLTVQTAMQVAAVAATKDTEFELLGEIASIGFAAYSVLTTTADTRSWYSLPKNVQLAKLPKNGDKITVYYGDKSMDITVPKKGNSIIYIRIPTSTTQPVINVIDL